MAEQRQLRSATLEILAARDEPTIGIGALVKALQRRGHARLQMLWKELDAMERERLIQSSGPPARRQISLVATSALNPPPQRDHRPMPRDDQQAAPQARPAPTPRNRSTPPTVASAPPTAPPPNPDLANELPELEDPATFLTLPEPALQARDVVAEPPLPISRPARAKTTRHKGISRVDYPDKHMQGFFVRVVWKGQRYQKYFADKTYGDRLAALGAALDWRNQVEKELGKPRTELQVIGKAASNTGHAGITRIIRGGHPAFQVTWYEDGQQRRRTFSIEKHGEAKALALARKARKAGERRRLARGQ